MGKLMCKYSYNFIIFKVIHKVIIKGYSLEFPETGTKCIGFRSSSAVILNCYLLTLLQLCVSLYSLIVPRMLPGKLQLR